ncbi:hypothetical protein K432DRAFT_384256 [Lepidopterella palustris CBS 459.81]|uniref:F-box domain-containing protein n=1 Tax=Lepidopterella palustris CBS 459.81 TaxID=1314670 RepID=A0A8E2E692_9PEZI|nr:hypothetical protein K432DRAFT_384256 [Lepidopterella palustris CBS 459.81]
MASFISKIRQHLSHTSRTREKSVDLKEVSQLTTSLLSLPVELLQHISTFLSSSAKAALALTNSHALHALGSSSWEGIKKSNSEYFLLLGYLQKDSSRLQLCRPCASLHSAPRSYQKSQSVSALNLHTKLFYPMDRLESDLVITVFEPGKAPNRARYKLYVRDIAFALNRDFYGPGHGHGVCLGTLSKSGTNAFKLIPPAPYRRRYPACDVTIAWEIAPRIAQLGKGIFIWHASYDICLSPGTHDVELWSYLKRALQYIDLRYCGHCKQENVEKEVVCLLARELHISVGRCVASQPVHHMCDCNPRRCACISDFRVRTVEGDVANSRFINIRMWRMFWESPDWDNQGGHGGGLGELYNGCR